MTEAVELGRSGEVRLGHWPAIVVAGRKERAREVYCPECAEKLIYIMSTTKRIILVAIAALSLLAMTAGTAAALRSLTWSKREISLLSRGLTLHGFATVICEVALNTTLNSLSTAKREGAIVGRVTVVTLSCQNGASFVLLNTPWNVKYKSIGGTLPNITGLTLEIERMAFRFASGGFSCLLTFEMTGTQAVAAGGTVGNLSGHPFSLRERSIREFCNGREAFEGEFSPVNGPITVRLA